MQDDYLLKYTAQFTPEGLNATRKQPWPEGYDHYIQTGDPSRLKEYTSLRSNRDFWERIDKEGLQKFNIDVKNHKPFMEALLKEMSRMLFSKENVKFLVGGNIRQLEPIRNKLKDLEITPFFKNHLINTIYQHLSQVNDKEEIVNYDQAENIADFFENIFPLAVRASDDALAFIADTKNAGSRKNVQHGEVKLRFARNLARIYHKHLRVKPVSSDYGLYIFIYAEACKACGFQRPNIKIAKDAIASPAKQMEK